MSRFTLIESSKYLLKPFDVYIASKVICEDILIIIKNMKLNYLMKIKLNGLINKLLMICMITLEQ
jgi:hypothetical protein